MLVSRLAAALGVADREEKVADYYNQMEQGRLPRRGRVGTGARGAWARSSGQSAERLRAMGEALGPAGPPSEEGAGVRAESAGAGGAAAPPPAAAAPRAPEEWDDVDELFRGGG